MNTNNTNRPSWLRRVSQLMAAVMITMILAPSASARILFQDDDFHDVVSEGLIINSDDGGDEDVTLQFGNDTTDATIIFDDGTGNLTFATPGGTFDFSDDNITTTGNITSEGLDANGVVTIGDGGDTVTIDSSSWDISAAGVGSGFTGFTSTGIIDFSGASRMALHQGAANPGTCTEGDIFYNTTDNLTYVCTATNTFTALSAGSQDFEGVYGSDGDNTLTTSNGAFTIAAGTGALAFDSGTLSVDSTDTTNITMTANDAGTKTFTIDAINAGAGTGNLDINADDAITIDSTNAGVSIDGAAASNFSTSSGDLTLSATTNSVIVDGAEAVADAVRINTSNAAGGIDIDSGTGGITIDSTGAVSIDGATSSNLTVSGNSAGTETLTISATNIGAGAGQVAISTDVWDITGAGVGSGFTGFSTGGTVSLGDNSGTVTIDSSDWDISATGDATGIGAITMDGLLTGTAGATLSGAAISLNNDSNFAVNVGTGTSTGAVSIGGGSNTVAIDSSAWDISSTGAASGFTTFSGSGNITTSGGDFIIGTTGLTETTAANDSGAFLIGAFDEFTNSNSTNVQDVLDDFDALIGSNAPNVDTMTFEPEYPNYALFADGANNDGKMELLYDSTNREQYYRWTTKKNASHDLDIRFRYTLPADFAANGDLTLRLRTDTTTAGDNSMDLTVRNDTDNATCHADGATTGGVAATWETVTVTAAEIGVGCTNDPGDVIEVIIKTFANNTSGGGTDVGTLSFAYTN